MAKEGEKMKKVLFLSMFMFLLSGCVHRIGDFTVASTKNMNIKGAAHRVDESVRVKAEDTAHIILFVPTGQANMKEAMDNAIEQKAGAVGLSNVTVKSGFWWIPYIYGQSWFEVEGNPVYEVK